METMDPVVFGQESVKKVTKGPKTSTGQRQANSRLFMDDIQGRLNGFTASVNEAINAKFSAAAATLQPAAQETAVPAQEVAAAATGMPAQAVPRSSPLAPYPHGLALGARIPAHPLGPMLVGQAPLFLGHRHGAPRSR